MDKPSGLVGVTLPPRIRAQVELLAVGLGLNNLGQVVVEFELHKGDLAGTYIKIGRIKNAELEQLAVALSALR